MIPKSCRLFGQDHASQTKSQMGDIEQRQQGEKDGAVVRVVPRIAAVPAAEWDACARGADSTGETCPANPFTSHAFLHALEESGSATRGTGGCRSISFWRTPQAALQPACPAISNPTPTASMSSTMPGPTRMSAPAAATIRSCRPRCPSRPSTGPRLLVRRDRAGQSARRSCSRPRRR